MPPIISKSGRPAASTRSRSRTSRTPRRPNTSEGWMPAFFGRDVFLCGYRIFARRVGGGSHRGLRILRSLTDRRWMCRAGNLLTRYDYRLCRAELTEGGGKLEWRVRSSEESLDVT